MLNTRHQRYAHRLAELIKEGNAVATLAKPSSVGPPYIQNKDKVALYDWLAKVLNIVTIIFGERSPQYLQLANLTKDGVSHSHEIYAIDGLLRGALNDLEHGFILGQEFLVAGEIFDSVLQQAQQLNGAGYKDAAAVLARVVLEDALRRIARSEGLAESVSAARLNDELKQKGRYPQVQWRLIQAWLDIGNSAAHGRFEDYDHATIKRLLEDIEAFLATEFRTRS
jgi:hypothetical protein